MPAYNPVNDSEEYGVILGLLAAELRKDGQRWTKVAKSLKGVSKRRRRACTASTR